MSSPLSSIKSVIIPTTDTSVTIEVPLGFRQISITTQPLNLTGDISGYAVTDLIVESNAVTSVDMTGTVTFKATPPRTFQEYDIPTGVVDLTDPSFVSTDIPIGQLTANLDSVSGATHLAITIANYL